MAFSDFYELHLPHIHCGGKWKNHWVITTVYSCGEPYAYLNTNYELQENTILKGHTTVGFFGSKLEAFVALRAYYWNHKQKFPYFKEYDDAIEFTKLGLGLLASKKNIGSRELEL